MVLTRIEGFGLHNVRVQGQSLRREQVEEDLEKGRDRWQYYHMKEGGILKVAIAGDIFLDHDMGMNSQQQTAHLCRLIWGYNS